jgi:Replication-relaxation
VTAGLDTYAELRLAEGKLLRWGERETKGAACALQPRDLEILLALARYRFLTTGQIAELCWEGRGPRAVRRRMTRLFEAGFVERFRPQTLRGSYQWTYCLARDGFRAAQQTGELAPDLKFAPRRESIFDYRYVIHDLRVNEWVLRYRELLGNRLLDWAGPDESLVQPPKGRTVASLGDGEHDVIGVEDHAMRPVQPDARLDIVGVHGEVALFVEYDRTRRVDKNYDKFRRYEAFLAGWWRIVTPLRGVPRGLVAHRDSAPFAAASRRVHLPGRRPPPAIRGRCRLAAHRLPTALGRPEPRPRVRRPRPRAVRHRRAHPRRPSRGHPAAASPAEQPESRRPAPWRLAARCPRRLSSTACRSIRSSRRVPSRWSHPNGTGAPTRRRPKPSIPPVLSEEGVHRWRAGPPSSTCPGNRAG